VILAHGDPSKAEEEHEEGEEQERGQEREASVHASTQEIPRGSDARGDAVSDRPIGHDVEELSLPAGEGGGETRSWLP